MYFGDHPPPHFHAEYGEYEAIIAIEGSSIIAGDLPARAFGLVEGWARLHRDELLSLWQEARQLRPLGQIAPLD